MLLVALATFVLTGYGLAAGGVAGAATGLVGTVTTGAGVLIALGAKGTGVADGNSKLRFAQRVGGTIAGIGAATGVVIGGWSWGWAVAPAGFLLGVGTAVGLGLLLRSAPVSRENQLGRGSTDKLVAVELLFTEAGLERVEQGAKHEPGPSGTHEAEDVEFEYSVAVNLEPLGNNRFRVPEPVSVMFVGPFGPMLKLGEVIEAVPYSDGVLHYRRTLESPPVWSRRLGAVTRPDEAQKIRAVEILQELEKSGCAWEFCVGNLTIQGLEPEGPSREVSLLIGELYELLKKTEA